MSCVYSGISHIELTEWCRKILKDFNIPIHADSSDKKLCREILAIETGIKSIDDDVTYRNLAYALLDRKLINEIESMKNPKDISEEAIIYDRPPKETLK